MQLQTVPVTKYEDMLHMCTSREKPTQTTNAGSNEADSPSAAGAKRLARTSRRAVHMASSSYRPLPKVPGEFSAQALAGKRPDWVLRLQRCSLHCADLPTRPLLRFQMPRRICGEKESTLHVSPHVRRLSSGAACVLGNF